LHKMYFSLLTHIFHLFTSLLILWCVACKWRFNHSKLSWLLATMIWSLRPLVVC
jgi:hypothetical protein